MFSDSRNCVIYYCKARCKTCFNTLCSRYDWLLPAAVVKLTMTPPAGRESQNPAYANIVGLKPRKRITPLKTLEHPTEEQGLIFNHLDGTTIREYLVPLSKLIGGPMNIIAASRVSGGRVIIFLSSAELVNKFQENHSGFQVNQTFIRTRKLKVPAQKIIFSNVSPTLPNTIIETFISQKLQLKMASSISILRVNPKDEEFAHVASWRRQVYVQPTDLSQLPPWFTVDYNDRTYRVFITADDFTCFKCGTRGHKAEECTNPTEDIFDDAEEINANNRNPRATSPSQLNNESFPPLKPSETTNRASSSNAKPNLPVKRGPSTIDSSIPESDLLSTTSNTEITPEESDQKATQNNKPARRSKRLKKSQSSDTTINFSNEELTKIDEKIKLINSSKLEDCQITTEQIVQLLPMTRGKRNKLEIVETVTSNSEHLLIILDEIQPLVTAGVKRTITALIKAMQKGPEYTNTSDTTSETDTPT